MIALVTGGSGGLGSECCERLARDGHAVVIGCHARPEVAQELADRITNQGGRALPLTFDVTDEAAVAAAVNTTYETFGGLDTLVLAAAHNTNGLLASLPAGEAARMQAVNVGGVMSCVAAAMPHLMSSERGRVITFSSTVAHMAAPGISGYAATKGGIEALTRALAVELGAKGITVNAIAPGFIDAGLGREPTLRCADLIDNVLPARRPGRASDVAAAVSFLVSEEADYITGVVLPVDGGLLAGSNFNSGSGRRRSSRGKEK